MRFTKMHGLGNDYVYVDLFRERVSDAAMLARAISDRHTGVGSDGLILIGPSTLADVRMEMYNSDGSRAEMCGNGIRCVAKYAAEHGLASGPELRIETDCGVKSAWCRMDAKVVRSVRVDMGRPSLAAKDIPTTIATDPVIEYPLRADSKTYCITCVSMGNPHAIAFVEDVEAVPLSEIGPVLEHAPEFPERINVHFVQAAARDRVIVRTWERGAGATRACGTGACAACVAGAVTHRTDRDIIAQLPGGELQIEWSEDGHVYKTGPAVEVFSGEWRQNS